jgi:hypothetical protein
MSKSTLFSQALRAGDMPTASALLLCMPELAVRKDAKGHSFVTYAMRDGRWQQALWLLGHGARSDDALIGWLESGLCAPEEVEGAMLCSIASLHQYDDFLVEPFMLLAVQAKRADVLSALLHCFGSILPKSFTSIWHLATKKFDSEVYKVLAEFRSADLTDPLLLAELGGIAIAANNLKAIDWLALNGLNVNSQDSSGRSMLGLAASLGREELCVWLCEHGVVVDFKDSEGKTPLYHAVSLGRQACARNLIRFGANPEERQGLHGQGDSPLRLVAKQSARGMRKILMPELERVVVENYLPRSNVRSEAARRL